MRRRGGALKLSHAATMLARFATEADMTRFKFAALGLATITLVPASGLAKADGVDGTYRGMIVCEKMKASRFMLRAPFDIVVSGKTVVAARPIFNQRGNRVVGSEIATGTLADDGSLKLVSSWTGGIASYQGSYGGTLTGKGGTFTGTQDWTVSDKHEMRSCTMAVVQIKS